MNALTLLPDPYHREVAFLGLGSNIPDRFDHLRQAVFALLAHPEIGVRAVSRVYETEYVGPGRQDPFLNAVAEIETSLPPRVLLAVLKGTEARLGRRPDSHLQPRPIDLDILLFGERTSSDPVLRLPHPGLWNRAFVLEPLADLAPDLVLTDSAETVADACERMRRARGPWIRLHDPDCLLEGPVAGREEEWRAALAVHCR